GDEAIGGKGDFHKHADAAVALRPLAELLGDLQGGGGRPGRGGGGPGEREGNDDRRRDGEGGWRGAGSDHGGSVGGWKDSRLGGAKSQVIPGQCRDSVCNFESERERRAQPFPSSLSEDTSGSKVRKKGRPYEAARHADVRVRAAARRAKCRQRQRRSSH